MASVEQDQQTAETSTFTSGGTATRLGGGQQISENLRVVEVDSYKRTSPLSFISQVNAPNRYGLARASKFYVNFYVPDGLYNEQDSSPEEEARSLGYFCEAAEIPGRNLDVSEMRFYGPTFKVPTKTTYNEVTFTLICDTYLNQKKFFDNWMELINPSSNYDFEYRDNYISRIRLIQRSDVNSDSKIYTFHDAFPISVAAIPTNWAEDGFHRVQVTFSYFKWDDITEIGALSQIENYFPDGLGYDPLATVRELQEQRNAFLNIVQGRTPRTQAEQQQLDSGAEGIPVSG